MKLETSVDRLQTVKKLLSSAAKISDHFRTSEEHTFGDILGLMAMMEKLTALGDLIRTEIILEELFNDALRLKDGNRDKLSDIFRERTRAFLQTILIRRIETAGDFCTNDFSSSKLMKFQAEMRETMTALRGRYKEIYKI